MEQNSCKFLLQNVGINDEITTTTVTKEKLKSNKKTDDAQQVSKKNYFEEEQNSLRLNQNLFQKENKFEQHNGQGENQNEEICQLFDNINTQVKHIFNSSLKQLIIKKYFKQKGSKLEWESEVELLKKISDSGITLPFINSGTEIKMLFIEQVAGQKDFKKIKSECQQFYIKLEKNGYDIFDKFLSIHFIRLIQKLERLHQLGYAHSDIKPQNIVIGYDFDSYFIDFGGAVKMTDYQNYLSSFTALFNLSKFVEIDSNGKKNPCDIQSIDEVIECEMSQLALTFLFMILPENDINQEDIIKFSQKQFDYLLKKYSEKYPQTVKLINLVLNKDDEAIRKENKKYGNISVQIDLSSIQDICDIIKDIYYNEEENKFVVKRINENSIHLIDIIVANENKLSLNPSDMDITINPKDNKFIALCEKYPELIKYAKYNYQEENDIYYLSNLMNSAKLSQNQVFDISLKNDSEHHFFFQKFRNVTELQGHTFKIEFQMKKNLFEEFIKSLYNHTLCIIEIQFTHYKAYKNVRIEFKKSNNVPNTLRVSYIYQQYAETTKKLDDQPLKYLFNQLSMKQTCKESSNNLIKPYNKISFSFEVGDGDRFEIRINQFLKRKLKQFKEYIDNHIIPIYQDKIEHIQIKINKFISYQNFKFAVYEDEKLRGKEFAYIKNAPISDALQNIFEKQSLEGDIFKEQYQKNTIGVKEKFYESIFKDELPENQFYFNHLFSLPKNKLNIQKSSIKLENIIFHKESALKFLELIISTIKEYTNTQFEVIFKDCSFGMKAIKELIKLRKLNNRQVSYKHTEIQKTNHFKPTFVINNQYSYSNSRESKEESLNNTNDQNDIKFQFIVSKYFCRIKIHQQENEIKKEKSNKNIKLNNKSQDFINILNKNKLLQIPDLISNYKKFSKPYRTPISFDYHYSNSYPSINAFEYKEEDPIINEFYPNLKYILDDENFNFTLQAITNTTLFFFLKNHIFNYFKHTIKIFMEAHKYYYTHQNIYNQQLIKQYSSQIEELFSCFRKFRMMENQQILKVTLDDTVITDQLLFIKSLGSLLEFKCLANPSIQKICIEIKNFCLMNIYSSTKALRKVNEKYKVDEIIIKFNQVKLQGQKRDELFEFINNLDKKCHSNSKRYIIRGNILRQPDLVELADLIKKMKNAKHYTFDLRENYNINQSEWIDFIKNLRKILKKYLIKIILRSQLQNESTIIEQLQKQCQMVQNVETFNHDLTLIYSNQKNDKNSKKQEEDDDNQISLTIIIDFINEQIDYNEQLYRSLITYQQSQSQTFIYPHFNDCYYFTPFNYDDDFSDTYISIAQFIDLQPKIIKNNIQFINNNNSQHTQRKYLSSTFNHYKRLLKTASKLQVPKNKDKSKSLKKRKSQQSIQLPKMQELEEQKQNKQADQSSTPIEQSFIKTNSLNNTSQSQTKTELTLKKIEQPKHFQDNPQNEQEITIKKRRQSRKKKEEKEQIDNEQTTQKQQKDLKQNTNEELIDNFKKNSDQKQQLNVNSQLFNNDEKIKEFKESKKLERERLKYNRYMSMEERSHITFQKKQQTFSKDYESNRMNNMSLNFNYNDKFDSDEQSEVKDEDQTEMKQNNQNVIQAYLKDTENDIFDYYCEEEISFSSYNIDSDSDDNSEIDNTNINERQSNTLEQIHSEKERLNQDFNNINLTEQSSQDSDENDIFEGDNDSLEQYKCRDNLFLHDFSIKSNDNFSYYTFDSSRSSLEGPNTLVDNSQTHSKNKTKNIKNQGNKKLGKEEEGNNNNDDEDIDKIYEYTNDCQQQSQQASSSSSHSENEYEESESEENEKKKFLKSQDNYYYNKKNNIIDNFREKIKYYDNNDDDDDDYEVDEDYIEKEFDDEDVFDYSYDGTDRIASQQQRKDIEKNFLSYF